MLLHLLPTMETSQTDKIWIFFIQFYYIGSHTEHLWSEYWSEYRHVIFTFSYLQNLLFILMYMVCALIDSCRTSTCQIKECLAAWNRAVLKSSTWWLDFENHLAPCTSPSMVWNKLFQDLHVCNKAWKKLVDNNGEWLHSKFCDLVSRLKQQDKHFKKQVQQKWKWKTIRLEATTFSPTLINTI